MRFWFGGGVMRYFFCEQILWKFTGIGRAVCQHSFSILFRPELQGNIVSVDHFPVLIAVALIAGLIVIDRKPDIGAAAKFVSPDQADGLSGFDDLSGMDKRAVFFHDTILS